MKTDKIIVAGLIGGVVSFFLGWLIFGIIFQDSMTVPIEGFMRTDDEMVWWAIIASSLLQGIFLSYVFAKWGSVRTAAKGAYAGAVLGALIAAIYDLSFYSTTHMFTLNTMVVDIAIVTVMMAVIGAVVAWWLGRSQIV